MNRLENEIQELQQSLAYYKRLQRKLEAYSGQVTEKDHQRLEETIQAITYQLNEKLKENKELK